MCSTSTRTYARLLQVNVVEGRMLHMGWVAHAKCLTAPREITYDPTLAQLLSNPIAELLTLRSTAALAQPR